MSRDLDEVVGPTTTPAHRMRGRGASSAENVAWDDVVAGLSSWFGKGRTAISPDTYVRIVDWPKDKLVSFALGSLGLPRNDVAYRDAMLTLLPNYMRRYDVVRETNERVVDVVPTRSKRARLDGVKSRMRDIAETLAITVDGLRDDIPRIGGRGVTMDDLHGAVVSLTRNAGLMLDLLEELESLRESRMRQTNSGRTQGRRTRLEKRALDDVDLVFEWAVGDRSVCETIEPPRRSRKNVQQQVRDDDYDVLLHDREAWSQLRTLGWDLEDPDAYTWRITPRGYIGSHPEYPNLTWDGQTWLIGGR